MLSGLSVAQTADASSHRLNPSAADLYQRGVGKQARRASGGRGVTGGALVRALQHCNALTNRFAGAVATMWTSYSAIVDPPQ